MFESITLDLSLKPFKKTDSEYIRTVCRGIIDQWRALLKNRRKISLMLWVGDGSELLDYAGVLDEQFEWARFVGTANLPLLAPDEPTETTPHLRKQNYMPDPPKMTYRILKEIVGTVKEEFGRAFPGATIEVGETLDIGPEFAISDFKYKRHTEICSGSRADHLGFIDSTATLHADTRTYAAYPTGIPEGEKIATFFGKQANIFLKDIGFDYLWLSNGLGFSSNPWVKTGKIFDGENYYPDKLKDTRRRVFDFWRLFREACPDIPLRTRGTNNTVGIDYASDGVPLYDIYTSDFGIDAPPNSPWAALNGNFGLEIAGHLSRCSELPSPVFPFRYYLHDPWWINSPWYDRYDGSPCDIYLPMAISRIDGDGKVEAANALNILTIDNSYGNMPDACVNEPLPHLLRAEKNSPDEPAPIVWIYPMREYTTSQNAKLLCEMNRGDNFIVDAINDGLPLSCVSSSDNFLLHKKEVYKKSVLLSPVPERGEVMNRLLELAESAMGVIIYGSTERLSDIPRKDGILCVSIDEPPSLLRDALSTFGYHIGFSKKDENSNPPALAISRHDGAHLFSVCNSDTTVEHELHFPLGAPILIGLEAEMKGGLSCYHFSRGEQRECRIFVEQSDGVISCRELAPVNMRYRRAISLRGLRDATVRLFSEAGCEATVSSNASPDANHTDDPRFSWVHDEIFGDHLLGEHISGNIFLRIGKRGTR